MARATAGTPPTEVERALALHRAGRLAEAAALYERALAARPDDVRALRNLGALRRAEGRLEAALALYARAAALAPDDPVLARNHGNALLAAGDWAGAAERLAAARARDPADPGLALALATARLAGGAAAAAAALAGEALARAADDPARRAAERLLALALARAGRDDEAEPILARLAAGAADGDGADDPAVLDALGDLRRRQGRPEEALDLWRRAHARQPASPARDRELGRTLARLGRWGEAEPHLRRALERQPDEPDLLADLATALLQKDAPAEAEALARRLLARRPDHLLGQRSLAAALHKAGRVPEAVAAYRRLLELDPGDEIAGHLLRALTGEDAAAAPARYVQGLFDNYAGHFEAELVDGLGYRGPELLLELLDAAAPGRRFAAALDLGCGTGLMGALLRPRADRLTGVDLAPRMVERARAKGVYDALEVAEIVAWLEGTAASFDLVAAADVLAYLGDLGPLFRALAARLAPGGLVLLTTEAGAPGETWRLLGSGRFRHGGPYLVAEAAAHGLEPVAARAAPLRRDHGRTLAGGFHVLRKPPAGSARADAAAPVPAGSGAAPGAPAVGAVRPRRPDPAGAAATGAGPAGTGAAGSPPRVLLAHDGGEGLGHVGRLAPVAEELRAAGCACLLGVRNLALVGAGLAERGLACVQVPYADGLDRPLVQGRAVTGYADLLTTYAFDVEDRLLGLARGWDGLLDLFRPDLVVADFAPFLSLAARGRAPVIQVGSGYTLPPAAGGGFPLLPEAEGPPWLPEAALLASANAVQRRRGRPELASLGDLLAAEAAFVTVLPLLDPYAALRPGPAAGPLEALPPPAPPLPGPARPGGGWFAYLAAEYVGTATVIEALAEVAGEGSLYVRGASPEQRAAWRAKGLAVHDRPAPLAAAITDARLLIHHGGLATTQLAAALGRPQLFVPRHMEHVQNARAVGRRGAGARLTTRGAFTPVHVRQAMRALTGQPRFQQAATALAEETAAAGRPGSLAAIVRACRDALARAGRPADAPAAARGDP